MSSIFYLLMAVAAVFVLKDILANFAFEKDLRDDLKEAKEKDKLFQKDHYYDEKSDTWRRKKDGLPVGGECGPTSNDIYG
jgi:hypothetical protein